MLMDYYNKPHNIKENKGLAVFIMDLTGETVYIYIKETEAIKRNKIEKC